MGATGRTQTLFSNGFYFNPRSREGSDSNSALLPFWTRKAFQSTLPRRERRITSSFSSHRARFQSTLPRRERPLARPRLAVRTVISIHAPAKGATVQPHRGGHGIPISIHAPAKGATLRRHGADIYTIQFQSTLPRRERHRQAARPTSAWVFQSTLPRRERPSCSAASSAGADFNPRSREGSDQLGRVLVPRRDISIHAPAKGATDIAYAVGQSIVISIHAPAKGATLAVKPVHW